MLDTKIKIIKQLSKVTKVNHKDLQKFIFQGKHKLKWEWYSFQVDDIEPIPFSYENALRLNNVLTKLLVYFNTIDKWVLRTDYEYHGWLTFHRSKFPKLKVLFCKCNIPWYCNDAISISTKDLIDLGLELVTYCYIQKRHDLNFYHPDLNFVINLTNHFDVNIISTDIDLLDDICKFTNDILQDNNIILK